MNVSIPIHDKDKKLNKNEMNIVDGWWSECEPALIRFLIE